MSTVTQRIPNFLRGISQQPDNRKFPGQLKDCVNAFPDYALGLLKRPGGNFITELENATNQGKWFSMLRDKQEKYVAQYDDNIFRIWSIIDGSPRVVDMGTNTGVPVSCNLVNLKADLDTYNTAKADTATKLGLLNSAQATYAKALDNQTSTDQVLFEVQYSYPSGQIEQTIKSGILLNNSGVYTVKNNDVIISSTTSLPASYALGSERTDEYPLIASNGYRVYEAILTVAATSTPAELATALSAMNTAQTNYDNAVVAESTALSNYQSEVTNCAISATPSNGYLYGAQPEDIKVLTLNDYTFVLNTAKTVAMDPLTTASQENVAFVVISVVAYNAEYIVILDGHEYKVSTDVDAVQAESRDASLDSNFIAGQLTSKINNPTKEVNWVGNNATSVMTITEPGHGFTTGDTVTFREIYANEPYSINSSGTVTVTHAAHGLSVNDEIEVNYVSGDGTDGKYQVTSVSSNTYSFKEQVARSTSGNLRRTYTEPFATYTVTVVDPDTYTIVDPHDNDGLGERQFTTSFTATQVGPGIYIENSSGSFTASTSGSSVEQGLYSFQSTVATVADLPVQCHNGYKVKVVNSNDITVDDMYVEFVTDGTATNGPGVWEETNGWGITYKFDPLTMPHQLVRQADGTFQFSSMTWEDRTIGDLETNPDPSFVGSTINNIFFYRNRLGFLSDESVILSKAGDYFNFFNTTALVVTDDDPIDISASSLRPVNMRYVRPTSVGLVLFSDNEQFLLTTDSDILSPKTSKINELSSYDADSLVESIGLGTSIAFISKTPLFTRLYELSGISIDTPPSMFEQTQIIPELIPSTVDTMVSSTGLSIISLGTVGSSTLYQFRYAQQGNERLLSTWYRWDLTGNLLHQFFDNNAFYSVANDGANVFVQSYDVNQSSETGYLTLPSGEQTDVCLDLWNVNPYRTYDSVTDVTRVYLPFEDVSGKQFSVVVIGSYIGHGLQANSQSVGSVLYPTVNGSAGNYYVHVDGDYRGRDLIVGYNYTMQVDMPKFYVSKSEGQMVETDFTSDLIIHRLKIATGLSGSIKYQINITGRPEWSKTVESVMPFEYELNNVNLASDSVHNIPIYQRNENLTFKIIGDTPMPVSLLNLTWEGNYNVGFYNRI